jgi:hypothetical protein
MERDASLLAGYLRFTSVYAFGAWFFSDTVQSIIKDYIGILNNNFGLGHTVEVDLSMLLNVLTNPEALVFLVDYDIPRPGRVLVRNDMPAAITSHFIIRSINAARDVFISSSCTSTSTSNLQSATRTFPVFASCSDLPSTA